MITYWRGRSKSPLRVFIQHCAGTLNSLAVLAKSPTETRCREIKLVVVRETENDAKRLPDVKLYANTKQYSVLVRYCVATDRGCNLVRQHLRLHLHIPREIAVMYLISKKTYKLYRCVLCNIITKYESEYYLYTTHPKARYHVNTTYKGTSAALLSDEYLSKYKVNIRNCIPTETRFPCEGTVNIPFKKTAGYHWIVIYEILWRGLLCYVEWI